MGKQFAERLKQIRNATKPRITQVEAARRAGVHSLTWSRWERGAASPDVTQLEAIAAALGTTAAKLIEESQ